MRTPDSNAGFRPMRRAATSFSLCPWVKIIRFGWKLADSGQQSKTGIKLDINQKYRADFKLAVGAANQTIEVTGVSAQVDTTSTQLGDVIGSQKMTSLPLNGRSYIDLLGLQAGVVPVSSEGAISDRN